MTDIKELLKQSHEVQSKLIKLEKIEKAFAELKRSAEIKEPRTFNPPLDRVPDKGVCYVDLYKYNRLMQEVEAE